MRDGADQIAAVRALVVSEHLAGRFGEPAQQIRGQSRCDLVDRRGGPLSVAFRGVALRFQLCDPLLERSVGEIDDSLFDGEIEALQALVGFGRPLS
ncbi:hypothetical protein [Caulobacter rhizosphaerae]|uniref:hypothetical protein n=1 Tax=Caulobacter rhizosphaerae TaxID=2010972 RepID=UPI001E348BB3|nr:hypothetical protein [Caulobacter rhizosphaerae]